MVVMKEQSKTLEIRVSKALYDREAIIAAAYALSGLCGIKIEPASEQFLKVSLEPLEPHNDLDLSELEHKFTNELIDQQLRIDLERRYGPIRQLIVQHAFSPLENLKAEVKKIVGRE